MPQKPLVFVSHIAEEKDLAILIKDDLVEAHLLGTVDVFVSSDGRVNSGGQSWLKNIEDGLKRARVFLILASPASVARPWVNIEAGAGWVRQLMAQDSGGEEIFVMPLCHSGQKLSQLPKPWDTLNAVDIATPRGLQEVLEVVGRVAALRKIPRPNFDSLLHAVKDLEQRYTRYAALEGAVRVILEAAPTLKPAFQGHMPQGELAIAADLRLHVVESIRSQLEQLKQQGLISTQERSVQNVGGPKHGSWVTLGLNVTQKYRDEVLGKIAI